MHPRNGRTRFCIQQSHISIDALCGDLGCNEWTALHLIQFSSLHTHKADQIFCRRRRWFIYPAVSEFLCRSETFVFVLRGRIAHIYLFLFIGRFVRVHAFIRVWCDRARPDVVMGGGEMTTALRPRRGASMNFNRTNFQCASKVNLRGWKGGLAECAANYIPRWRFQLWFSPKNKSSGIFVSKL